MSSPTSYELLSDRTKFKIYAAECHFKKLKELQIRSGNLAGSETRINTELELDCFFSQILGARDSLLFQINKKIGLGIPDRGVTVDSVRAGLIKLGKGNLLRSLDTGMKENHWLWLLKEFRNECVHQSFIRKHVAVGPKSARVSLIYKMIIRKRIGKRAVLQKQDKITELIQYLKQSLRNMRRLVNAIKKQEPLLQ
jgi:hypothetical protein